MKNLFRLHRNWILLLVFLAATIPYANTIYHDYAIDDDIAVTGNKLVQNGLSSTLQIFTTHYHTRENQRYEYRPIPIFTFAIEREITRANNPHVSHAVNVLLYGLACLLFYLLAMRLTGQSIPISLASAIIFAWHPVHSEIVNNIKCRDELLFLVFGLGAWILSFNWIERTHKKALIYTLLLLLLSMLSKRTAVILIPLIPLSWYLTRNIDLKVAAGKSMLLMTVPVLFLFIKAIALSEPALRTIEFYENPYVESGFTDRLSVSVFTAWVYFRWLIWPFEHAFYYGFGAISYSEFPTGMIAIGIICSLILAATFFIPNENQRFRILVGSIIVIGLMPFLNLVKPVVGIVGERFALTASLGSSLLMSHAIITIFERVAKHIWFRSIILLVLGMASVVWLNHLVNRNKAWKDICTLIESDLARYPHMYNGHMLLGSYSLDGRCSGDRDTDEKKALEHYQKAAAILPNYFKSWNNLGVLQLRQKDYRNAIQSLQNSVKLNPESSDSWANLGKALFLQERRWEVMDSCYREAFTYTLNADALAHDYALFALSQNIEDQAIAMCKAAIAEKPDSRCREILSHIPD